MPRSSRTGKHSVTLLGHWNAASASWWTGHLLLIAMYGRKICLVAKRFGSAPLDAVRRYQQDLVRQLPHHPAGRDFSGSFSPGGNVSGCTNILSVGCFLRACPHPALQNRIKQRGTGEYLGSKVFCQPLCSTVPPRVVCSPPVSRLA